MIYGVVAIVTGLYFIYKLIADYFVAHRTAQLNADTQKKEDQFNQDVANATEEIKNAKLRYDAARKQLDNEPPDAS